MAPIGLQYEFHVAHSFPPSSLDRRSTEFIVTPKKVVGCRGASRNAEGCWGVSNFKTFNLENPNLEMFNLEIFNLERSKLEIYDLGFFNL